MQCDPLCNFQSQHVLPAGAKAHNGAIHCLRFSPSATMMASCSVDSTCRHGLCRYECSCSMCIVCRIRCLFSFDLWIYGCSCKAIAPVPCVCVCVNLALDGRMQRLPISRHQGNGKTFLGHKNTVRYYHQRCLAWLLTIVRCLLTFKLTGSAHSCTGLLFLLNQMYVAHTRQHMHTQTHK